MRDSRAFSPPGTAPRFTIPGIRDYWVSIGNENARELGRMAALNLLGAHLQPGISGESIFDIQGIKAKHLLVAGVLKWHLWT